MIKKEEFNIVHKDNSKNLLDKLSLNLLSVILEFLLYEEFFDFKKINKKFNKIILLNKNYKVWETLKKKSSSFIKKFPEILFLSSKIRNPISHIDFEGVDERIIIANYLNIFFKNKEELIFLDKKQINEEGLKYLIFFISFTKCSLKKLDLTELISNEEYFVNSCFEEAIKTNHSIEELKISMNNLSSIGYEYLGKSISCNKFIKNLQIIEQNMKFECFSSLYKGLQKNSNIQFLDLSNNKLTYEVGKLINNYLKINKNLKYLNLENNLLEDKGLENISDALIFNQNLIFFDISQNLITKTGVEFLLSSLNHRNGNPLSSSIIKILNLRKNLFNNEAINLIAEIIKTNKTITCLDVSDNELSGLKIKCISNALEYNQNLSSLDISYSNLSDVGCSILTEAILKNKNLESLNIRNCNLTDSSFYNLQKIIDKLNSVNFAKNFLCNENIKKLEDLAKTKLKFLGYNTVLI